VQRSHSNFATGCDSFELVRSCGAGATICWLQTLDSNYLHFHFEFAEGQIIKISPNYQNPVQTNFRASNYQNIGCIDADFCDQGAIFSIFRNGPEYIAENGSNFQKLSKTFAPKFANLEEIAKNCHILIIWPGLVL
jgi:hypothetical protein